MTQSNGVTRSNGVTQSNSITQSNSVSENSLQMSTHRMSQPSNRSTSLPPLISTHPNYEKVTIFGNAYSFLLHMNCLIINFI